MRRSSTRRRGSRRHSKRSRRQARPFAHSRRLRMEPLERRLLLANLPPVAVADSYTTPENTSLVVDPPVPEDVVLLFDDFELGASADWSDTTTSVTPVGDRAFLGEFGNEEVFLSLNDLPSHELVTVEFDLYVLKSWDGNRAANGPDIWSLDVDGATTLLNTTFRNAPSYSQAFPDDYGSGSHPPRTGAVENNTLGYGLHGDSVYSLTFQFDHSADALQLRFSSSGGEGIDNESWGLDNVRVAVPGWALGVLANDTDPDGDPLSAELVSPPSHGSLGLNADGTFEYVPTEGFHGIDTFEYRANDGVADSDTATVTVTVNDAPRAVNDAYVVERDTSHSVTAADGVLRNDRDANADPLSTTLIRGPSHGTLMLSPDGSFVYEPEAYFAGVDTFTYQALDGYTESNVATVRLRVEMIDADSSAVDDFYHATADGSLWAGLVNGTFDSGDLTAWTTFTTPGGTLGGPGFPDVVTFDTNGDSVDTESVQFL
ncbi:MAG: tandem-95 repeat protein, partial [Planctomycetes bacterium]|nr:tandem-95 repeat protein [Planctomycetota bacterium]